MKENTKKILLTIMVTALGISLILCVVLFSLPEKEKSSGWSWEPEINQSGSIRNIPTGEPTVFVGDAAYTWWTGTLAVRYVGERDQTYFSCVSEEGKMIISSFDHNTGVRETYDLAQFEKDDHNSAAMTVLPDGRILAVYARHNADKVIRWRISDKEDIGAWGKEQTIQTKAHLTYIQIHRISEREYRVFYRYNLSKWASRTYDWVTDTWSDEHVWLNEPNGGQYYLWIQADKEVGKYNIFMTCHPVNGTDQNIRYGYFDLDGNLYTTGGKKLGNLNVENNLTPRDFDVAYEVEEGYSSRLYDVAYMGDKVAVLFGVFVDGTESDYMYCYYDDAAGKWVTNKITNSGRAAVLGNRYFGGVSFDKKDMQTIYVSAERDNYTGLEKWVTTDYGKTWTSEIIDVPDRTSEVCIRPIIPYNAHDEMELLYMKGQYPTYLTYNTDIYAYGD